MYILCDTQGAIKYSSHPLKEGLNVFGKVYGVVGKNFVLTPMSVEELSENISPAEIDSAAVFFNVLNGRLEWAAPDICAIKDLFYAQLESGNWILGDNFFEVTSQFSSLSLHAENVDFFIRHGYFTAGQTFFQKIFRVRVGMKLRFTNPKPVEESIWELKENKGELSYETFKSAFSSVFNVHTIGDRDASLMSAGYDSGLMTALCAIQFKKRPIVFTTRYTQVLKLIDLDGIWAKKIAEHHGLEHVLVEVDFNQAKLSDLPPIIQSMPLAAHPTVGFLAIYSEVAKRGLEKVWSGQSADSVYNLGPTGRGIGGLLKRLYLSKEYWQSFPDIKERSLLTFFARAAGALGPVALLKKHGVRARQPKTFSEFRQTFQEGKEALPLPSINTPIPEFSSLNPLRYQEAKKAFFENKVQTFLIGGDPRVHYAAGNQIGKEVVLPYTAANMMHFFRGLELTLHDVISPKRYIYRYLAELLGKRAYSQLYGSRKAPRKESSYMTWREWQKFLLDNTVFGKELRDAVNTDNALRLSGNTFKQDDLQHNLAAFWFEKVMERIKNSGVEIQ